MNEGRMIPVLVGLDHRTAPLELREQLHADDDHLLPLLASLRQGPVGELVVLSTCNRYEVYAITDHSELAQDAIVDCLLSARNVPTALLLDSVYRRERISATRHLFRVAAGLESLVLGETQILRQIAGALDQARAIGGSGPLLNRMFTAALHTGKRARTETAISQHTLSVSHAAVRLVERELATIASPRIVVVGAGEMATLAASALTRHPSRSAREITILSRNDLRARDLARRLGASARPWDELSQAVASADAVLTATSANQPILRLDEIAAARPATAERPLLLVDIGVPRNVAPATQPTTAAQLFDIDDLQAVVAQHRLLREAEIAPVEAISDEEAAKYAEWLRSRRIIPVLTDLRAHAEGIAAAEIEHAQRHLPDLDDHEREVMARMARRIVNKLLHTPTVSLKWRAAHGDHFDYDHAIRKLFALEVAETESELAETDSDDD
jgi:glutamyl-tRNA reductase